MKTVITVVLLLVAMSLLFYGAYTAYAEESKVNLASAVWAAGGIAILLSILKVVAPLSHTTLSATGGGAVPTSAAASEGNPLFEGGGGSTSTRYRAADSGSNTPIPKRWWRKW